MGNQAGVHGSASAHRLAQQRQVALIGYVLYALAPLTAGLTGLFAVGINYFQRGEMRGSVYESHFKWQIRLFWESLLWLSLGFLTVWFHYLGLGILLFGLLRFIYRLGVGFFCLNRGKPLPTKTLSES